MHRFVLLVEQILDAHAQTRKRGAQVMSNRANETAQIIRGIEQGLYPTTTDVNQCPRCAFYFCCPSLPPTTLS